MSKPIIRQFQDDLNDVLDKYRDQGITVGEAIGAIEMVRLGLFQETVEVENDF